jgi:hypothetical protein
MWLDKFIFYGRSVGPTCVYLAAAESLANGARFSLGRYLLGSTYHLLHQVAQKLLLCEPISNLGGPWWFINMWLNVVLLGTKANENPIGRFFQTFYNGLSREHRAWMPYIDEESRSPLLFNLADKALNKDNDLMMAIITPQAIPVKHI